MFKASKKRLKFIEATDYKDDQLRLNLEAIFRGCQSAGNTMSNGKFDQFVDGIQRVIYAIKTTLTPEIVKQGYRDIGMYPVNFRATMANCTVNVGLEQQTIIRRLGSSRIACAISSLSAMSIGKSPLSLFLAYKSAQ